MIEIDTEHKEIFSRLQDDESRELFLCRYRHWKTRSQEYLWDELRIANSYSKKRNISVDRNERDILELIADEDVCKEGVIIYGAGSNADHCLRLLNGFKIKTASITDSDKQKHGKRIAGHTVVAPDTILSTPDCAIIITPRYQHHKNEIRDTLLEMGISPSRFYYFDFQREKQYFGPSFMQPVPDEVYIDGGVFDGLTIQDFLDFAGSGKIYGFEPDPECYARTREYLKERNITGVDLIQKGLYDHTGVLQFDRTWVSAAGSRIDKNGKDIIEVTSIDEVTDERVTFIKMDVEGAELRALHGAQATIRKHLPRLAICIYHKHEDIVEIPQYIHSLHVDYKFYIRHHVPWLNNETVLYAIT